MKISHFTVLGVSATLGVCTFYLASCGSSSSSTAGISSLPKATGSVSSTSASLALASATTGLVLKDLGPSTDWTGKSRAFCETAAMAKNVLREAGGNDKVLCYIGSMEANGLFSASYDGTYKYYTLSPEGGTTMHIKFKITSTNGTISDFEMFTCQDGSTQSEYLHTTNSNGTVSMTSVGSRSGGGGAYSFGNRVTVDGTINSSGAWLTKSMRTRLHGSSGTGGSAQVMNGDTTIDQTANDMTITAFRKGSYGGTDFETDTYGVAQILNADSLSTIAMGDGAMKYSMSWNGGTATGGGGAPSTGTKTWTGDDMLAAALSGTYYDAANAGTLPTAEDVSITFSSDETWDCNAPAGTSFTDVPNSAFTGQIVTDLATCNTKYAADEERGFVDCHSVAP